jgi:hypothetical protein
MSERRLRVTNKTSLVHVVSVQADTQPQATQPGFHSPVILIGILLVTLTLLPLG